MEDMGQPVNISFNTAQMYVRWSEIVVDKLHQAMDKYNVGILDGPLWQSIQQSVVLNGGNAEAVILKFLQYGRLMDMQVGRGHRLGDPGSRKKKRWFSKTYYSQVQRLSIIYIKEFGEQVPFQIKEALESQITVNV